MVRPVFLMKKWIWIASFAALAGGALWLGRPAWRENKERRFASQARENLASGDERRALLAARQALAINSNNLAACEVMAALADQGRAPAAIHWRRRIAEIQPVLENRIKLVACALRFEQAPFPLAVQTLREIGTNGHGSAPFHLVAAQLALKRNQPADAERHFAAAARLEPTNQLHRLNLAVVQLQSRDTMKAAEAEDQLAALQEHPELGAYALRSLAMHQLSRRQPARALETSARLLQHRGASFEDTLQHLTILHETKAAGFEPALEDARRTARTNAVFAFELSARLIALERAENALAWLRSLPDGMRNQQPVPLAQANAHAALKQWRPLEEFLTTQKWGDREFVRLALLSFAVRNQADTNVAGVHWQNAARAAADRPDTMALLAQMSSGWRWPGETEGILWQALRAFPAEKWPVETLLNAYTRDGNTRGLYSVYATLLERQATNVVVRNNLASLALLLGTNIAQAHQLADAVHRDSPTNAGFASTCAWSLHLRGRSEEALALMEKLSPADLSHPSIVPYYATLLAARGQAAKAAELVGKADVRSMLPEEAALIEAMKRRR
jgi:hypothetical protein